MSHTFLIRKKKVLDALFWLKKYNILYNDIEIDESNLDWMGNCEEKELPISNTVKSCEVEANTEIPAHIKEQEAGIESSFGIYLDNTIHKPGSSDNEVTECLEKAVSDSANSDKVNFPYVLEEAVNEYGTDKIFCKAFPWLFPGGYGDLQQYREESVTPSDWLQSLLYYCDGRFALDKMFIFFALNFILRHANQKSGSYFIDGFFKEGPKTLQDLQADIKNGNTTWIERIMYFAFHIAGSAGYWRKKK